MMFDWVNECREGRRSRMGGGGIVEKGEIWGVVWERGGMEGEMESVVCYQTVRYMYGER